METFYYKIGRLTWSQTELTWKQSKMIVAIFDRLRKIADPEADFSLDNIIKMLHKHDMLKYFLKILLSLEFGKVSWLLWPIRWAISPNVNASNFYIETTMGQIMEDFFLSNKKLESRLGTLGKALSLIYKTATDLEKSKRKT